MSLRFKYIESNHTLQTASIVEPIYISTVKGGISRRLDSKSLDSGQLLHPVIQRVNTTELNAVNVVAPQTTGRLS
jgi:hypothetical protein